MARQRKGRRCKDRSSGRFCGKPAEQVYPDTILCPEHERLLLVALAERERDRVRRKNTAEAQRKAREREVHRVAVQAAGEYKPHIDRVKRGGVWEVSGGLPTLGEGHR